jgi:uncharacterized membrane protein
MESLADQYGGRILGSLLGLILGFIYLFVGFWKALFFVGIVGLGFIIGRQWDHPANLKSIFHALSFHKWMRK